MVGHPEIVICVNKMDLHEGPWQDFLRDYEAIGYPVVRVSAQTGAGHRCTAQPSAGGGLRLCGAVRRRQVLAAQSGQSSSDAATGHVSEKIKRGRHTTRVAELLPYEGGYIVDTPGFSAMEMAELQVTDLPHYFPEFRPYEAPAASRHAATHTSRAVRSKRP